MTSHKSATVVGGDKFSGALLAVSCNVMDDVIVLATSIARDVMTSLGVAGVCDVIWKCVVWGVIGPCAACDVRASLLMSL